MSPLPEFEAWTQFKNTLVLPRLAVQAEHILRSRPSRAKIELTQCIFRFLGIAKNTVLPLLIVFFFSLNVAVSQRGSLMRHLLEKYCGKGSHRVWDGCFCVL